MAERSSAGTLHGIPLALVTPSAGVLNRRSSSPGGALGFAFRRVAECSDGPSHAAMLIPDLLRVDHYDSRLPVGRVQCAPHALTFAQCRPERHNPGRNAGSG